MTLHFNAYETDMSKQHSTWTPTAKILFWCSAKAFSLGFLSSSRISLRFSWIHGQVDELNLNTFANSPRIPSGTLVDCSTARFADDIANVFLVSFLRASTRTLPLSTRVALCALGSQGAIGRSPTKPRLPTTSHQYDYKSIWAAQHETECQQTRSSTFTQWAFFQGWLTRGSKGFHRYELRQGCEVSGAFAVLYWRCHAERQAQAGRYALFLPDCSFWSSSINWCTEITMRRCHVLSKGFSALDAFSLPSPADKMLDLQLWRWQEGQ